MSFWGQMFMPDAASVAMLSLIKLHDWLMLLMVIVIVVVTYMMFSMWSVRAKGRCYMNNEVLEDVWTYFPVIILVAMGTASFEYLYAMDEIGKPSMSVKVVGHQWYWSYEYSDLSDVSFDSFMVPEDDLVEGDYRLLEVDNRLCLPLNLITRLVVTSTDVIHSLAVPSLGVKVDAIPGRLNQVSIQPNRYGVFYGMCSEICGANHALMPIVVEVVTVESFKKFINSS